MKLLLFFLLITMAALIAYASEQWQRSLVPHTNFSVVNSDHRHDLVTGSAFAAPAETARHWMIKGDNMECSTAKKLKLMDQMTASDRESFLEATEKEWQSTKEALVMNLSSQQANTRFSAAYLLGLYRYADAVDSLAKVIMMESKDDAPQKRESRWGRYPAVEALIKIGKQSIPAMLRNLENSNDENSRQLSARVIYYVEGQELAMTVVANAIAKQSDPAKKANLESSLKYFEREKEKR